jgi:hypothetical protein
MIRPRPTQHVNGTSHDYYHVFQPVPAGRADAWCACGAKLSRYRSLGDIACAPCQARIALLVPPSDLHPELPAANQRWRRHDRNRKTIDCPGCGGPMHYTATQCRACRYPGQR